LGGAIAADGSCTTCGCILEDCLYFTVHLQYGRPIWYAHDLGYAEGATEASYCIVSLVPLEHLDKPSESTGDHEQLRLPGL